MTEFIRAPLEHIEPSPTNPRKHFDAGKLRELADTIVVHGVISPVTVRPHPAKNGHPWQLVVGERRYRASHLAGALDIPAIVEDLDDKQVAERQLLENGQRADIDALEEADAYQALIDHHGYTVDTLVSKTGRSRAHLYGRLKLLALASGPRAALATGRIPTSIAELIARQPTVGLQEELLRDIFGETDSDYDANIQRETITPGLERERSPLSHRAVLALVHRKYSTRLELACFELGDETLAPAAGACTTCPHRSGNQPELFADLSRPADVCTKPTCFADKTLAVWKRAEDRAFELSRRVVTKAESEVYFGNNNTLVTTAPWVDPAAELPWELRSTHGFAGKVPTWEKLLGKKHDVPVVLVQDPTGAPHDLLDRAAATQALIAAGKIDKPTKSAATTAGAASSSKTPVEKKADRQDRAKEKAKTELREASFVRVLAMVADADPPETTKEWLPVLRWLLRTIEPLINLDAREMIGARRDKDLDKLVVEAPTLTFAFRLLAEMLVAEQCDAVLRGVGKKTNFDAALTLFGVDWDKAQALAKAAADAEKKSAAAKKKAGAK